MFIITLKSLSTGLPFKKPWKNEFRLSINFFPIRPWFSDNYCCKLNEKNKRHGKIIQKFRHNNNKYKTTRLKARSLADNVLYRAAQYNSDIKKFLRYLVDKSFVGGDHHTRALGISLLDSSSSLQRINFLYFIGTLSIIQSIRILQGGFSGKYHVHWKFIVNYVF